MSDALRDHDGIDWIRKRQAVPRTTPTFAFNRDPDKVRRADRIEETSDLQTWFGGAQSIELREDVIGLGRYGKTLTMRCRSRCWAGDRVTGQRRNRGVQDSVGTSSSSWSSGSSTS
jgi:hypothetical protein